MDLCLRDRVPTKLGEREGDKIMLMFRAASRRVCEDLVTIRRRLCVGFFFFFSSRRRHTRLQGDWSSDVCSSDLPSVHTSRPFLALMIAVPVSWHIGKTPPAAMLAFFRKSNATNLSLSLASGSSKIGRASCRERV